MVVSVNELELFVGQHELTHACITMLATPLRFLPSLLILCNGIFFMHYIIIGGGGGEVKISQVSLIFNSVSIISKLLQSPFNLN